MSVFSGISAGDWANIGTSLIDVFKKNDSNGNTSPIVYQPGMMNGGGSGSGTSYPSQQSFNYQPLIVGGVIMGGLMVLMMMFSMFRK